MMERKQIDAAMAALGIENPETVTFFSVGPRTVLVRRYIKANKWSADRTKIEETYRIRE